MSSHRSFDDLDLDPEEPGIGVGVFVQPIECSSVLSTKTGGNPDDCLRIGPRGIGEELAEVGMVRPFQLVLDDHHTAVGGVSA